ncbi:MAG: sugar transferase [Candidatus Omnitrophica bacterium]|nr:sugar transferase [Candidatus Omnitrophota bacterium]
MIKERVSFFRKLVMAVDALVIAGAFLMSICLRDLIREGAVYHEHILFALSCLPVIIPVFLASLFFFRMYESFRTRGLPGICLIIVKSTLLSFACFSVIVFIFKFHTVSRIFVGAGFLLSGILLAVEKTAVILFFRRLRRKGYNYRHILIVGTGPRAQHFMDQIKGQVNWGYRIMGLIDLDAQRVGQVINGARVLGTFEDMSDILNSSVIDEVVFVVPRSWLNKVEELLFLCESRGLRVHVAVDYFSPRFSRTKIEDLKGLPFLTFESTPDKILHLMFKRSFDTVCAALALIVFSPVLLGIALLVKLTSRGPVFFRQERVGLYGRPFTLYKFRTMVKNAESRLDELLERNEMQGPVFKLEDDPRVTSPGRFLRKYSLDELPQLWNILKGDMSIVGPRPPIPTEVREYDAWQRRRLSMRPGLTCLWQVSGRNRIVDFERWVKLDLEYIDRWSLILDFKIIARTIPVSILGIGAK